MRTTGAAALVAFILFLAACGGEADVVDDDEASRATDQGETPIADDLKRPIDKAAAVEDLSMARKAEMDKRLAEMEGETDDDEDP